MCVTREVCARWLHRNGDGRRYPPVLRQRELAVVLGGEGGRKHSLLRGEHLRDFIYGIIVTFGPNERFRIGILFSRQSFLGLF